MTEEDGLTRLFAAYRAACPEPDAGAGFMPGIWTQIETRRRLTISVRRLTSVFVAAAAALALAMVAFMARPLTSPVYTTTYVEALSDSETPEAMAYAELVSFDPSQGPIIQ